MSKMIGRSKMSGFSELMRVEQALNVIKASLKPITLGCEKVSILSASGRILSKDILSSVDVPSIDRSIVDGYAVVSSDTLVAG